jgi:hypothetical protein
VYLCCFTIQTRLCNNHSALNETQASPQQAYTAPIFVSTENSCQICQKTFTFFVRKNHCKNWYIFFLR